MQKAKNIVYYCLLIKLAIAVWLPFFYDEAYYWFWGNNLRLSYFDHPPFVSYLYFIGQAFDYFGQASRWPGIIMGQASIWLWLIILKNKFSDKQLIAFSCLMNAWPLFGAVSVVVTPDVPLIFFWTLSVYYFQKLLQDSSLKNYFFFGVALGLGGLSKYQIVLIIPALLIYLGLSKSWSKLRWEYIPVSILAGAVFCSPVFIWNALNNWDSFLFQIDHGLGEKNWQISWTLDYLGSQILILFPTLVWFAFRSLKNAKKEILLIHCLAWFPLAFFLITSFKGDVEANWPIMAYPAVAALAVYASRNFNWLKWTAGIWIIASVLLLANSRVYWLPMDLEKIKIKEFYRYPKYEILAKSYTPMYADSFQMAGYLSYLTKTDVCKLRAYNRRDFYDYHECSIPKAKRYYFLVGVGFTDLPEWAKDHKVNHIIPVDQTYKILEIDQP